MLAGCVIILTSCDDLNLCEGKGTLEITNSSCYSAQELIIDNVSYGFIDPGETMQADIAEGGHYFRIENRCGGGCNEAYVKIIECQTSSFNCDGK